MHGHALIRKLIARIRKLQEHADKCTCGGGNGITERDAVEV